MATPGGDHKRLVIPENKVWQQVVPRDSNTEHVLEMEKKMLLKDKNTIPNDIVVEILLRLPAKSLVRLRWACKYWFNLITRDHDFIMKNFHGSTTISVLSTTNYAIADSNKFQCNISYNYPNTMLGVYVSNSLPFNYPPGYVPKILGSCNGLILLDGCKLCIWNPCTEEYKVLPDPLTIQGVPDNGSMMLSYGFGYDHTTDDYKIIMNKYFHGCHVQVYSRNLWRRIEPNTYTQQLEQWVSFSGGVFFNGAFYWMDDSHNEIVSFDFGSEKIQYVTKIPKLCYGRSSAVKIHVFEGSLCVVETVVFQNHYHMEIWVMKDYSVPNNGSLWTKLPTIVIKADLRHESLRYARNGEILQRHDPLRYTRNGEILLLKDMSDLVLYDPKNGDVKTLCRIFQDSTYLVKEVYTESLVSLNSGTYTGQEPSKNQEQEDALMVWRNYFSKSNQYSK